ncbi:hypothetical protein GL218_03604 [Daldinia childiae]|uniref:uncharacterized protein n=1 Tax=Daldinia childiae TaxID=326645 RepID=UPI001445DD68|nr:uncharacterized protein GL218_03604 [Daldinia childiae]KAF3062394.1 hypothetical protein GL218_03604 [Daldinia childiae]
MGAPRKGRSAGKQVSDGDNNVIEPWRLRFKNEFDDDDEDIKVFMKQEDEDVVANNGAIIQANIEAGAYGGNNNPIIIGDDDLYPRNSNGDNGNNGHGLGAQDPLPADEEPVDEKPVDEELVDDELVDEELVDEELERIVMAIDGRHCDKYRWFIERYIRQIHEPHVVLSRQLYYRRVMGKHKTIQIQANPNGRERWVVKGMRPSACKRLDYEATRAHFTARNTARSLDWSAHKKRVPADRLDVILTEVTKAYDWPEIVTVKNVDEILTIDDIRDLDAYDGGQGLTIGAFPPHSRISVESDLDDIYDAEPAIIGSREPQVSQRSVSQPSASLSSTLFPGNPRPSASLPARPEKGLSKRGHQNDNQEGHGEKRLRLNNEGEGHLQDRRHEDEKRVRLEALHQEFMKKIADISNTYHRRRLEIETEYETGES